MELSDAELRAYLSGDADADLVARIESAAIDDPEVEDRLMNLDDLAVPVREAFGYVKPRKEFAAKADTGPTRGWLYGGVAASVAALALVSMFALRGPQAEPWHVEVAAYQALYVPKTISEITVEPDAIEAQFAHASAALGRVLDPEQFRKTAQATLKRAQVLGFQGAPLIQVVYAGSGDTPFALCIMAQDNAASPQTLTLSGLAAEHWSQDGWGYILIGGTDEAEISKMAAELRNHL